MNFENFENYLYFVCQPASEPAVRPGCARCRALKITQNIRLQHWIYELLFQRQFSYCTMVILLSFLSLLSYPSFHYMRIRAVNTRIGFLVS